MATTPADPLQLLQAALTAPENTKEQADLLASLRKTLEHHPAPIPILVHTLIGKVVNVEDSLLKRWVLDLSHFALARSTLSIDQRTQMALQLLDPLAQLLSDSHIPIVKVVIQSLTTVYPLLFRQMCTNRSNPAPWHTLTSCKNRILDMVWSSMVNLGVKLSAMKFVHRVILVQTRGVQDPRLQKPNDPNISFCPVDHPFIPAAKLEAEGQKLLEALIGTLYSSQDVDLLSAMLNSWATLAKQRPNTLQTLIPALKQWTPTALESLPASSVRSVEKAVRILLVHINRNCIPSNSPLSVQINEALAIQAARMEEASQEERRRKAGQASAADGRKRSASVPAEQPTDPKRQKLESEASATPANIASTLAAFDFTSLPASLITDLIIANLESFTEPALEALTQAYRQNRGPNIASSTVSTSAPAPVAPTAGSSSLPPNVPTGPRKHLAQLVADRPSTPSRSTPPVTVKAEEPVDPLQMDIDQDELEFEPETLNAQLSGDEAAIEEEQPAADAQFDSLQPLEFKLPQPQEPSEEDRMELITNSIARIWTGADELPVDSLQAGGTSASEVWMLLLVRMVTRVAQPPIEEENTDGLKDEEEQIVHDFYVRQDQLRQKLCDYIMDDFPSRVRLATTWMNEEWYNDQTRLEQDDNWRPNYDIWLNQVVTSYQTLLDGKDRTFSRFLLDLPAVPPDVLGLLRELCVDESSDKVTTGFITLRGLVLQRPSLRTEALNILLELTTHPDKKTRAAAINVVKAWVPHMQSIDTMIREFALQMLRKLQLKPSGPRTKPRQRQAQEQDRDHERDVVMEDASALENGIHAEDEIEQKSPTPPSSGKIEEGQEDMMEDGQLPYEDLVHTPYLPERIELPARKSQVLQYVELLFALCVKVPEFLEELFHAYGQMDVTVQEAIQDLITALVKSLGPNNGKLLTLMRQFPPGADSLALRVLTIFTENGRASNTLVALVKGLINERDLDARFLIPIIAEMDRADIIRHLPRIVSILNGQPENKNIVRNVFSSIVAVPPSTFGSVSSNLPRVRHSELLPPDRLMVLLHQCEKEIGLKSAMEAISICFSMTEIFRSEVLGAVMQQLVDEAVLPTLFLRTVIQAVTMYKTLVGFVSTTLLSRLITKKIWTNPPLWEGFIRCAKATAPSSFNALLQLPKDQLRELVDKQPSLKTSLRDYVTKRAPNKARLAGLLDIFGEVEDGTGAVSTPAQSDGSRAGSPVPL